jgi:hypothetical protein
VTARRPPTVALDRLKGSVQPIAETETILLVVLRYSGMPGSGDEAPQPLQPKVVESFVDPPTVPGGLKGAGRGRTPEADLSPGGQADFVSR